MPNIQNVKRNFDALNEQILDQISLLPDLNWDPDSSLEEAADAIVSAGFKRKFSRRSSDRNRLREVAALEWEAYDESLAADPPAILADEVKLAELRERLRKNCAAFKVSFSDGWVGPGETFRPSNGWVSPLSKFEDGPWTVTPNCLDLFKRWVLSHRRLRRFIAGRPAPKDAGYERVVKTPNGVEHRVVYPEVPAALKVAAYMAATGCEHYHQAEFEIKLQENIALVNGNRFTTVEKNIDKDRPICVEPLGNTIMQKVVSGGLQRCLKTLGMDVETGQERHHQLLKAGGVATLDLSNASDSISLSLVRAVFPGHIVKLLECVRSPYTYINGRWVEVKKISSMGNGTTFELMTLLLYTALEHLCPSVFGDDIVVPQQHYDEAVRIVEALGFTVNEDKSFGDGVRAESCGLFVHGLVPVMRFDFRRIEDKLDAIIMVNKLSYLIERGQVSSWMAAWLSKLQSLTLMSIDAVHFGPWFDGIKPGRDPNIPNWVMTKDMANLKLHNPSTKDYCNPVFLVTSVNRGVRHFEPKRHRDLYAFVGLKQGRKPELFNKQAQTLESRTILVDWLGNQLMTRAAWNEIQRKK